MPAACTRINSCLGPGSGVMTSSRTGVAPAIADYDRLNAASFLRSKRTSVLRNP
jgi:hypothetical protein